MLRLLLRILVSLLFIAARNRLQRGSRPSFPPGGGGRLGKRSGGGGSGGKAAPPLDRSEATDVPFTEIP